MATPQSEYRQTVLEARNEIVGGLSAEAQREMADTYARYMGELINEMGSLPPGAQRQRVQSLLEDMEQQLRRYMAEANAQVEDLSKRAAEQMSEAHRQGLNRVNNLTERGLQAEFGRVPERAVESMFARRDLDVVESFKTLSNFEAQQNAQQVADAITRQVAQGDTYQEASERIARSLASGDETMERALDRFGLRGGLRRGEAGPIDPDVQQLAERIGFNARRIALTEVQQAAWEANRLSSIESPVVLGVVWTLSAAHPEPDICDVFAEEDLHGLGPGVYRPETVPPKPHPFCLCSQTEHQFRDPGQWDQPKPEVDQPNRVNEEMVRKHLDDPTDNAVQRTMEQANTQMDNAFQSWQQ